MNTPIYDFVTEYLAQVPARLHMPGHKGRGPLGCESRDITEIPGADSLYEAAGIIAQSEANASRLFGCPTFYSTEGSSLCIRAMLSLAVEAAGKRGRPCVLAARNVHKTFLSAAALLDLEVEWLWPEEGGSYLSADVTPEALEEALVRTGAGTVYLTCPDYLGNLPDLAPLAEVCHRRGALLLVDNAHGAYLRFLSPSRHPVDLGADLCCDSAHKTLPVLTGGAYLHIAREAAGGSSPGGAYQTPAEAVVRDALALFGSTSPSYLILQSLDLCNPYLEALPEKLAAFLPRVEALKARLRAAGWSLVGGEPLKLTLAARSKGWTGTALAAALEKSGVYCEFADPDFLVCMFNPENTQAELDRLEGALAVTADKVGTGQRPPLPSLCRPQRVCSLREALLAPAVTVPAAESLGRVLARPGVSCPPAVPILMPGERIDEAAIAAFRYYRIETVSVLP